MAPSKPILIVGAGLAGCMMAIELARLDYRIVVFEKRALDSDPGGPRRSINLALAPATMSLLKETANLSRKLKVIATPLQGRVLHPVAGKPKFQAYAKTPSGASLLNPAAGASSVSRAGLNSMLRSAAAAHSNVEFRFGQKVTACDPDRSVLGIEDARGRSASIEGEIIIGADGALSAVRRLLALRRAGPRLREDRVALSHCYKEIRFAPPASSRMRKRALHIWPRAGFLLMALPNPDGDFTGGIFLRKQGSNGFSALKTEPAVRRFFEKNFQDVVSCMPDLAQQYAKNPVSPLTSVQCDPWHVGRAVLIGDACHTLYPFSGQGANLALEDCLYLRRCIEQFAPNWPRVFSHFTEQRKPQIDYLCQATRVLSPLLLSALPQDGIAGRI